MPTTQTDDRLVDRLGDRLDDVRDSASRALSADDAPSLRELGRVRRKLDDVEEHLADGLAALGEQQSQFAADVRSSNKQTTFPRKLFWLALGGAAAAFGTWLADPDRGKARRNSLADQVTSQARDLGDQARVKAQQAVNTAKGTVAETGRSVLPEDVPDDPVLLQQRIKSQVMGRRDDVSNVVLTVGEPGHVTLKGTVHGADTERDLVAAVKDVEGVVDVTSELNVAA